MTNEELNQELTAIEKLSKKELLEKKGGLEYALEVVNEGKLKIEKMLKKTNETLKSK